MEPRDKIIQRATDLFCKKGFEAASVREIATAAGVNVAMINYYFGSKENLLEKVVEERLSYLRNIFEELVRNPDISPIEKIDTIIELVIERKFSNRKFNQLLHRELSLENRPQLKETISELLMLNITPIKQVIKDGIKAGVFKSDIDLELTVATVAGTIHYLLVSDAMCRKILGKKSNFDPYNNPQLKKRLGDHTKRLIRAHLLKKQ